MARHFDRAAFPKWQLYLLKWDNSFIGRLGKDHAAQWRQCSHDNKGMMMAGMAVPLTKSSRAWEDVKGGPSVVHLLQFLGNGWTIPKSAADDEAAAEAQSPPWNLRLMKLGLSRKCRDETPRFGNVTCTPSGTLHPHTHEGGLMILMTEALLRRSMKAANSAEAEYLDLRI
jgi:hypothetical protein